MKDPAFLFYTSDFLTGTMTMTDDQVGKYIRLLCLQHQKGLLSEKDMLFICKSYDEDIFMKFEKNGEGLYFNRRLEEETIKRRKYSESRSKNRISGHKHEKKEESKPDDNTIISSSYDQHMENENENRNINIDFDVFWNLYDKKIGDKIKILKKWKHLSNSDRIAIIEYIPKYIDANPDKKYRKNPETFLNNKSWNDEIIKHNGTHQRVTTRTEQVNREAAETLASINARL